MLRAARIVLETRVIQTGRTTNYVDYLNIGYTMWRTCWAQKFSPALLLFVIHTVTGAALAPALPRVHASVDTVASTRHR